MNELDDQILAAFSHAESGNWAAAARILLATSSQPDAKGVPAGADELVVRVGDKLQPSDPETAARLFRLAAISAGAPSQTAVARQHEVAAWGAAGDTRRARVAATAAQDAIVRLEDPTLQVTHLINLAVGLNSAGLSAEALRITSSALDLLDGVTADMAGTTSLLAALVNMATIEIDRGHYEPADFLLTRADAVAGHEHDAFLAGIRVNQAMVANAAGNQRDAIVKYEEAERLYHANGNDPVDVGYAIRGQAGTLAQIGRYDDALARFETAIALFSAADRPDEATRTRIGLVMAAASLGRPVPRAELDELARTIRSPLDAAQMWMNIANITANTGESDAAEALYQRARRLFARLGRRVDVARVDTSRAGAIRRSGRTPTARRILLRARRVLADEHSWRHVSHADHNLAVVYSQLADNAEGAEAARLSTRALTHALGAVAHLDLFRHDLPTLIDRRAVTEAAYPGLFPTAIQCALRADRPDVVAALVERARTQTEAIPAPDGQIHLRPPPPLRSHTSSPTVVGGDPTRTPLELSTLAGAVVGERALWLGWWTSPNGQLVRTWVGPHGAGADIVPAPAALLQQLRLSIADTIPADLDLAGGDHVRATRIARWRAATGPFLDDPILARQMELTFPPQTRRAVRAAWPNRPTTTQLLRDLSHALLGDHLNGLAGACSRPTPVLVAPPPEFGRVPWAALPVTTPAGPMTLVEAADLVVGLPAALLVPAPKDAGTTGRGLWLADPTSDLPHTRRAPKGAAWTVLGHDHQLASPENFIAALDSRPIVLVVRGHIRPGSPEDPTTAGFILKGREHTTAVTANDLARTETPTPPVAIILGCDGAGAATGPEWASVATALVWRGTRAIVTSTWPVLGEPLAEHSDIELVASVCRHGPLEGLWRWQRRHAQQFRTAPVEPASSLYRWAGLIVLPVGSKASIPIPDIELGIA